jgi:hypothetical protein
VNVSEDGTTGTEVIEARPPILASRVQEVVRRWRFEPRARTESVVVEVRFRERTGDPCDPDPNHVVEARLPDLIEVQARREGVICHEAPAVGRLTAERRSPVHGRVVNESGRPLAGGSITFYGIGDTAQVSRRLRVDDDGRFLVSSVPPGRYAVAVYDDTRPLQTAEYGLTVRPDGPDDELTMMMFAEPPRANIPQAVVRAADLPVYPSSAIGGDIEGVVDLRLSFAEVPRGTGRHVVTDVDAEGVSPSLVEVAVANASTWRFDRVRTPVLKVRYTFRLLPADCSADQRTLLSVRFPHAVELVARRRLPC